MFPVVKSVVRAFSVAHVHNFTSSSGRRVAPALDLRVVVRSNRGCIVEVVIVYHRDVGVPANWAWDPGF